MKRILLLCSIIISICAKAQTDTYFIDWSFGSNPSATGDANSNRTVEVGDTVIWTWYASGTHSVESASNATETFDSGLQNAGSTFSYTFTQEGTNDYFCNPHPGNMFGTITVVPDGTLSTEGFLSIENISIYPNPAKDVIYLELRNFVTSDLKVSIYNALGQEVKKLKEKAVVNKAIDISAINSGLYLVRIVHGENSVTRRLLIK